MMTASLAPLSDPRIPMESPDALFCPDAWIQTPVPAPLLLFQCIRFPLRTGYETDGAGLLVRREDRFQENTIVFPDGSRFTATVSASERFGLPNAYDVSHFLGLLRLGDEGGLESDGRLRGVEHFSQIAQARNPDTLRGGVQTEAVKRMLQRFGNTTVTANFRRLLGTGGEVEEEESTKYILEYDRRRLEYASTIVDHIKEVRLNPYWVQQTHTRSLTSWLDVDLYDRQTQAIAKIAYLRLAIAATQGQIDRYRVLTLSQWEDTLGSSSSQRPNERAAHILSGLRALAEDGVLSDARVEKAGKARATTYTYYIEPGPVLQTLRHLGRIDSSDPARTRVLLWHLQHLGIAESEARGFLTEFGGQVQDVLRRVHWLRTIKEGAGGRRQPIASWRHWVAKALTQGWRFEEPGYLEWVERQQRRFRSHAAEPVVASAAASAVLAAPELPPALPDNVWGQAIAAAREATPLSQSAVRLLCGCWLEDVSEHEVRIGAKDPGTAAVLEQVYARHLTGTLSELLGRPVSLAVSASESS